MGLFWQSLNVLIKLGVIIPNRLNDVVCSLCVDPFLDALSTQIFFTSKAIEFKLIIMGFAVLKSVYLVNSLKQMRMHQLGFVVIVAAFFAKIEVFR